jgi:hypothetical protein
MGLGSKQQRTPEGRFVFDPPIKSKPVSFTTERYVFNGVAFTQLERLHATEGKETHEELRGSYRNLWEECMFSLKFPEHRFPKTFKVNVYDQDGNALDQERNFVLRKFKAWPEIQTLSFTISEPLPDVEYSIRWDLPEDASSQLSGTESGFIGEVTRRLLGLRSGCAHPELLREFLEASRRHLSALISSSPELPFSVSLYV